MSERRAPPEGWVTVAAASAALIEAGDRIDPSNVSRYLARFPEIGQEKNGKFRFVDPVALAAHRKTNVQVGDKRASREEIAPTPAPRSAKAAPIAADDDDEEDQAGVDAGSPLNQANLRLKSLQIRDKELDLAIKEGDLVPKGAVAGILSDALRVFVGELERQETMIAGRLGRDAARAFRDARKLAQAKAEETLRGKANSLRRPSGEAETG